MVYTNRYSKYRNSAIVSFNIADAIDELVYTGYVSSDMESAARNVPLIFHPKDDHILFKRSVWYNINHDTRVDAARRVWTKFNGWYGRSTPLQRAGLALNGMMVSHEMIDNLIDRVIDMLRERHRCEIIDADDTICSIEDYPALIDSRNITAVLDLPVYKIAASVLEQQVQRMVMAPAMPLDPIQAWFKERTEFQTKIYDHHYKNVFARTGISPKRARKIIAKSYELLQMFFGREAAQRFIHGDEHRIHAKHFIWGIKTDPNKIIELTIDPSTIHTPFKITLYDHDENPLCNGCVLWPDTPVLDQAVAFLLSTADPEEELDLLRQMNESYLTDKGKEHPLLKAKAADRERRYDLLPPHNPTILPTEIIDLREEVNEIEVNEIEVFVNEIEEFVVHTTPTTETRPYVPEQRLCYEGDETNDPDFDRRYYSTLETRRLKRRLQRMQDPLIQKVQQAFFGRLDAPPELLRIITSPHSYWDRYNTPKVPAVVARYITTKELPR